MLFLGICGQTIHEIDGRDIVYQNSLTLCGNGYDNNGPQMKSCDWSDDVVYLNGLIYIAQPNLNRIVVFHATQFNVVQVITTDPQPRRLHVVESDKKEPQIWVLCDGSNNLYDEQTMKDWKNVGSWPANDGYGSVSKFENFNEKYLKNRKTIQVVRLMNHSVINKYMDNRQMHHTADVVHLQPVDGHFDLVHDLFLPDHYESIFHNKDNKRVRMVMQDYPYAYATHWEERSLIKISVNQLEYLHSIHLADCQPIAASVINRKAGGLVAIQCQTPITHQLNGQLIFDQVTDAILVHNTHLNAHKSYLSPDNRYLVSIYHDFGN